MILTIRIDNWCTELTELRLRSHVVEYAEPNDKNYAEHPNTKNRQRLKPIPLKLNFLAFRHTLVGFGGFALVTLDGSFFWTVMF